MESIVGLHRLRRQVLLLNALARELASDLERVGEKWYTSELDMKYRPAELRASLWLGQRLRTRKTI